MTPENLSRAVQREARDQLTNTGGDDPPSRAECRQAVRDALSLWGDTGLAAEAWIDEQTAELRRNAP